MNSVLLRIIPAVIPWLCLAATFAGERPWPQWLFVRSALFVWGITGGILAIGKWHRRLSEAIRRVPRAGWVALAAITAASMFGASRATIHPVWLPVAFLAGHLALASSRPALSAAALLLTGLITLGSAELFLVAIRNTEWLAIHPLITPLARTMYYSDWNVIQMDPACAREDSELLYTLRPGECRFRNLEFDTVVRINSLGVRDDEESLHAPDIVIVGDSTAMGWGVEQEETFASRIEQATGLRVLNAGISSYGTVRELTLLKRVDLSRARHLIIQYSENDLKENVAFEKNGFQLSAHRPGGHTGTMRWYQSQLPYRPGEYLAYGMQGVEDILARRLFRPDPVSASRAPEPGNRHWRFEEMRVLVEAIVHSPVSLSSLRVLIVGRDAEVMRGAIEASPSRAKLANVSVADLPTAPGDSLPLDRHLNARGHEKAAAKMVTWINESKD